MTEAAQTALLVSRPGPNLVYVGYAGQGNLGDDAIWSGLSLELQDFQMPVVFRTTAEFRTLLRVLVPLRSMPVGIVLGGGTLVFRRRWLDRIEVICNLLPEIPRFAVGIAAETSKDLRDDGRVEDWAHMLMTFQHISVRGATTQRSLAEAGVSTVVSGDPALLLSQYMKPDPDRTLGINVGSTETIYGNRPDLIVGALGQLAKHFANKGWRIVLLPMERRDLPLTEMIAADVERTTTVSRNLNDVLSNIEKCTILIGERLHSIVLAAAAHVPSISLAYRPKSLELAESLGTERWTLRTDDILGGSQLIELAEQLLAEREDESRRIQRVVRESVNALRDSCNEVSRSLKPG